MHTQNVESYWNRVKITFKRMKGCHVSELPSYLDDFYGERDMAETAKKPGKQLCTTIPV